MDPIDYNQERYDEVCLDFRSLVEELNVDDIQMLPLSGLTGENVARSSGKLNWYQGPSLLDYLEKVEKQMNFATKKLQDLLCSGSTDLTPSLGYSGTLRSGCLNLNEEVFVLPSGRKSKIKEIVTFDGKLNRVKKAGLSQSAFMTK